MLYLTMTVSAVYLRVSLYILELDSELAMIICHVFTTMITVAHIITVRVTPAKSFLLVYPVHGPEVSVRHPQ